MRKEGEIWQSEKLIQPTVLHRPVSYTHLDVYKRQPNWEGSGSKDAPEAYPGEALAKDPIVTNVGDNPCFVRVKVTGWDALAPAGAITYRTDYVDNKLGDNWSDCLLYTSRCV